MEKNIMEDFNNYYQCEVCAATFKLSHSLDEQSYNINHCPFCGENELYIDEIVIEDD
jgi:rRNA maturation endonuclease Nob1